MLLSWRRFATDTEASIELHGEPEYDVRLDDDTMFDVHVWNGRWFTRLSTWRYDPSERLKLAEEAFKNAMTLKPDRHEAYLGLGMVNYLRKNAKEAEVYLAKAKEIDPQQVASYERQPWVRQVVRDAL